ncbi:cytochrome P450 [Xylariaceae sp. FL0255]|nr:cytochrome P450 [Xylariaceae sp. FL0255]
MAGLLELLANELHKLDLLSWQGLSRLLAGLFALWVLQFCGNAIYYLYFSPLRHIPGPWLWIVIPGVKFAYMSRGSSEFIMRDLHDRYGEVVRVGPNALSFIRPEAWKDIYGHGHAEYPKYFPAGVNMDKRKILAADSSNHFRMRRAMLPAFSDKALLQQEPLIRVYVDLLIQKLRDQSETGQPTDMVKWYNLTTFDLIADLAYGTSLQGLEKGKSNKWIESIKRLLKVMPVLAFVGMMPALATILQFLAGPQIRKSEEQHLAYVSKLANDRIHNRKQADRGDFMDFMMRSRGQPHEMSDDELVANADLIMVAGSETTASLLSGLTYWILKTPHVLKRITEEVRDVFSADEDITFNEARSKLPYMMACLEEGLRIYPPVPLLLLRVVPDGPPVQIAGITVPEKTHVGVHQLSAYHSEANFHRAREFIPERWLSESTTDPNSPFFNDRRDVHRPFSFGPRDCIGRNLAQHEMRLILAKMLWNFDLVLDKSCDNWDDQKIFALWEKPPLKVHIRPRAV